MKEVGSDETIIHPNQRFDEIVKDIDVVLVTAMGDAADRSFAVLKRGGRLVTTVGQPNQEMAERYGVKAFGAYTQPDIKQFAEIGNLIDAGKVKVFISHVFPIDQAQTALDTFKLGKHIGKIGIAIG
jgi:NADPH:quinone reductase-like Zn-dependent oxidoreductase